MQIASGGVFDLPYGLLMAAIVIVVCVIFNRITSKMGIPMLFAFILLGMFFGSDGIVKIPFDNFTFAEQICSVSLIFIMFYGGFGTKWSVAKPEAPKAIILSSFGTLLTALFVGLFCHYALGTELLSGLLIGSVISSTDAASVFSILRSKHLNLKYGTASILELESGSNDPFAYMLTIVILSVMNGDFTAGNIAYMLFAQVVYGILTGAVIAILATNFLRHFKFASSGFDTIFLFAIGIISYALPTLIGGNGYLSAYITGIIMGNSKIPNKKSMVIFFDGVTGLLQMLLFFLLGLLSFPMQLIKVVPMGFAIALFLTFIARPFATFLLLTPFRCPFRQQLLIAWSGMRGAASIVFAIITVIASVSQPHDIFHIVFFIVLFSILLQGSLIPFLSKKLSMVDNSQDVMKTFTDYSEEEPIGFLQCEIHKNHSWNGKTIAEIALPPESIIVLVIRNKERIIPNGRTVLYENDTLILSGKTSEKIDGINLYERKILLGDEYVGKKILEISKSDDELIIMIRRKRGIVIPKGNTVVKPGDVLVINHTGFND